MATDLTYPHLTVDDDGNVRIGRTRYKVLHLATEHYHHGWTAEELLRQHPDLRPEEVYGCLTYFYDHFDSLVSAMTASAQSAAAPKGPQPVSREELLRRQSARDT